MKNENKQEGNLMDFLLDTGEVKENKTKWKKGERKHICYARNESGIRCRHCSARFANNSRNIEYYARWSYLCKDCKTLVSVEKFNNNNKGK